LGRLLSVPIIVLSSASRDVERSIVRRTGALLLAISLFSTACDRKSAAGVSESVRTTETTRPGVAETPAAVASGWDDEAGPFLVLPTVDGGLTAGSLLRPEATELTVGDTTGLGAAVRDGRVELFSRSGRVGSARIVVEAAPRVDAGCTAWPVARLTVDAGQSSTPWTAAFAAGRVTPVTLDSIEGLAPRDSGRLVIDLTRLASGLRDDTVATFKGLPFVVLHAWRSKGLPTEFVVATLARRVNQEDSPKEERLVLVVDQTGTDARQWTVAWHERASGREEELVVAEPLLAFRLGRSGDVNLLFGRDDGVALGAAVLSRAAGGWRVMWESAVAGCD
jgi:hypothetical protein